jgi:regulator of protease activity HflC (stomatin/prohibitin superfamily)
MSEKRRAAADIFKEQQGPQPAAPMAVMPAGAPTPAPGGGGLKTSEELQLEKEPIRVRETGFGLWRRIIVPPNVYVVHTRLGRKEPVTLGLGISFRYNPFRDAYLVVPAAMQTIGVVANCITKEKQGINILAYVQWQIDNFAVAYRKLDFSDSREPLGVVNAQLREQAEAAIKDKIATMSVEDVLTDKAPIIEELTTRLKAVAEGRHGDGTVAEEGLGIKIVTVQIREALVSSQKLWEDLQAPFRHEQEKMARVSYLQMQDEIRQKELATRQASETREAETMVEIERIKQGKETEAVQIKLAEEAARFTGEQESIRQKIGLEEETTTTRRDSEQRLQTQAAQIEQAQKLAAQQRLYEATLQQATLDNEAEARRKTLQIEQALHALQEEGRLEEEKFQAEQEALRQEVALKSQRAEVKQRLQELADAFEAVVLAARLTRRREETLTDLELEEARNRAKQAVQEKEIELSRLQQEVRNLIGQPDLLSRLLDRLPEVAAHMPQIQELRVLQTGPADPTFDSLSAFLAKMLALAESLGIPLRATEEKGG